MARKSLWTFFIVLAGVAILFGGGLNQSYQASTTDYTVESESVTQDFDSLVPVEESDSAESFNDTVRIYNSSQVELTDGTDYDWYTNGTVQFYNTTNTNDGNLATVSYDYEDHSESTEFGGDMTTMFGGLLLLLLLFVAGRFVLKSAWGWD